MSERFAGDTELTRPDHLRVVFDQTRGREILSEFLLSEGDGLSLIVEHDRAGTRGALVEGE